MKTINNQRVRLFPTEAPSRPTIGVSPVTYGLDLSLRHGALVEVHWGLVDKTIRIWAIYQRALWGKVNACPEELRGIGLDSSIEDMNRFARMISIQVPGGENVITDWVPGGFFRSNIKLAIMMAYIMGNIQAHIENVTSLLAFVPPSTLRSLLELAPRSDKYAVHGKVRNLLFNEDAFKWFTECYSEDILDAVILALYPAYSHIV